MIRRDIPTALLALAALARLAQAQEPGRIYRVGWLDVEPPGPSRPLNPVWVETLFKLGWVIDKNLVILYRYTDRAERLPELADELVRLKVDAIVTFAAAQTEAAQQATKTIPILFLVHGDPVGRGHVASLARPGGNITGGSQMLPELCAKRVQLLRELLPGASRIAVLWNAANPSKEIDWQVTQDAARALAFKLEPCRFTSPDDLQAALELARAAKADALLPLEDSLTYRFRRTIVDFASSARLPAIYAAEYTQFGGLMSYYTNPDEFFRLNAHYLDKILRGAKPADLPVAQATRFMLAVNLKTAKALNLKVPQTLVARADVVVR